MKTLFLKLRVSDQESLFALTILFFAQKVRRPPLFESKEEEVKINEPKLIKEVIASGGVPEVGR